jgi:hypothetical protein
VVVQWLRHCVTNRKVAVSIPLVPKFAGSLPTEAVGFFLLEKPTACGPKSNTRTTNCKIRTNEAFKKKIRMVSEFFIDIILSAALWPWGRISL